MNWWIDELTDGLMEWLIEWWSDWNVWSIWIHECKEIATGLMIVNTHSQRCRLSSLVSSAGYLAYAYQILYALYQIFFQPQPSIKSRLCIFQSLTPKSIQHVFHPRSSIWNEGYISWSLVFPRDGWLSLSCSSQSLMHSSSRLADIRSSTCLGSSSYYQSDLQLVLFDNLILLCNKFGHIPSAVDVPPSEPVALLLRQVDDSIGRKLGGLGKNFGASACFVL